jgi:hypothetical protein
VAGVWRCVPGLVHHDVPCPNCLALLGALRGRNWAGLRDHRGAAGEWQLVVHKHGPAQWRLAIPGAAVGTRVPDLLAAGAPVLVSCGPPCME